MIYRNVLAAMFAFMALLPLSGCVRRTMTIKSEPPHALVYLEGRETGQTPCTVEFVHYGVREITLYKPGYETKKVFEDIRPPWYQIVPIDFFFEVLWPFTLNDERVLTYRLEPIKEVSQKELLERAKEMSQRAIRVPLK